MRMGSVGLMAVAITLFAGTASAQDEPRVGVVMGYPASVGIIWRVSDTIALRPEISATSSSSDLNATSSVAVGGSTVTNSSLNTNDNWQVLAGVSALFYVSKHDALQIYVSPRWAFTRVSSSSASNGVTSTSSGNVQFVSGSIGGQYALGTRFAVFGEIGLGYTYTTNTPTSPIVTLATASTARTIGTRSGAGVILYF